MRITKILFLILGLLIILILAGLLFFYSQTLSNGEDYRPDDQIIAQLESTTVEEINEQRIFGDAYMENRDGNYVIHLVGSPYEMGYQHGILLKEQVRLGVITDFADPIAYNSTYKDTPGWIKKRILDYLEFSIYSKIEENTPIDYLQELKGIADGAGLDFATVFRANFLSDLKMALIPQLIKDKAHELLLSMEIFGECSGFAATNNATMDGQLIIGRNTDYGGQGKWITNQTVFFYHPENQIPYVRVSTAGLIKCNTAMNAQGIVIGGHFMGMAGSTPEGLSFTILENEIMRKADSLQQAKLLVQDSKRGGSFALFVSSAKENTSIVIEANAQKLGIKEMENNFLFLTNFGTTVPIQSIDLMANYNVAMRGVFGRYVRLSQLIKENYGRINPQSAAIIMGNHYDTIAFRERAIGYLIGTHINVTSAVFKPQQGYMWVATGDHEPACLNPYVGYDVFKELQWNFPTEELPVLQRYKFENPNRERALFHYMEAMIKYNEDPNNLDPVISDLNFALENDASEPHFYRILSTLFLYQKQYETAIQLLEWGLEYAEVNNEVAHILFILGVLYDLMGKRDEALMAYNQILELYHAYGQDYLLGINAILMGLAKKHIQQPFNEDEILSIPLGFSLEGGLE